MKDAALTVRLFGEFDLRCDGAPLPPLGSARAEGLLAYLLLHRRAPQPRQRLAYLLWPDSTEAQARTNLRHVLHILRKVLPEPDRFLHVTPRALQWRCDAAFWLDVAAFEDALERASEPGDDGGRAALEQAAELYTADLLEGYYDDWALGERERLRRRHVDALERLTSLLEASGEHGLAIGYAERLLRIDPLQEGAYRTLMRLHDGRGDRARALHVYHVCTATLDRELGVEPSGPTRAAYRALLSTGALAAPVGDEPAPVGDGAPSAPDAVAPFVGREREWERLTALWREAEQGRSQLVLLTGEPGIGKTRLVEELRSWCAHRGASCADARSYQAEGTLAYAPVVAWLRSAGVRDRLARLPEGHQRELVRLLPELGDVAGVGPADEPADDEHVRRRRLFDAAAAALLAPGRRLLLVADDLHWSDPDTLQFLHYLLRADARARVMVAATARSGEFGPDTPLGAMLAGLQGLARATEIEVGPLSPEETAALAGGVAASAVDEGAARRLFGETEGNPLFVVEALRAGWPGGTRTDGVSTRVQAVIESHLGRLPEPSRHLVGLAAAFGGEFTAALLASAADVDQATVVRGLDDLWRHRVIREHGAGTYDFSHDKVREVAYRALGPAQRHHAHLCIARALEAGAGTDPAAVSGRLAAHYETAGAAGAAASWYRRAAEAAQRLYASAEAVRFLERALRLLDGTPPTRERLIEELAVLTALPAALAAVDGYASPRVSDVHRRALDVARRLGVEPEPPLLRSVAIAGLTRGDFEAAGRVGRQLLATGERDGDDVLVVEANYVLGVAAFWQGDFEAARTRLETAVHGYRPEHREAHVSRYGQDPKVVCLGRLGNALWFLGRPEEARQASDDALSLAAEIGHPYSAAVALVFAALLALDSGDLDLLRRHVGRLEAGRQDGQGPQVDVIVDALDGYLQVVDGRAQAGLAGIRRAMGRTSGAQHAPGFDAALIRVLLGACEVAGDAGGGLAAATRAIGAGAGSAVWEAEARRLRGEFLAQLGAPRADVEEELLSALDVARRQGAVAFEQRVFASLRRARRAG